MFPVSALSRFASAHQVPVINALALLLRFANIFFATTAPLFFHQNAALLKSTPLLGLASMGVLGVVLFLPGQAPRVLGLIWAADLVCGVMLLNLFGLGHPAPSWVFFLFAAALGLGMAGTEVRAMELAVQPTEHRRLRKRISWFSFAKSLGLGSGFLAGGAAAGSPGAAEPARILVGIAAAAIILLSVALCLGRAEGQEPEWDREGAPSQPIAAFGTLGLIVLVFIVINLSNALIPYNLARVLPKERIGALLAVEAITHGLGALLFKNGVAGAGDRISYVLGLGGSVLVMGLLALLPRCGPCAALLLLAGLGFTTAMAYMASTVMFYAAEYPKALFPRVAVQKLASSSGRALGSWLAWRWLAGLDR